MDPRTPVLVGCGQTKQRCDDPADAREPLALMVEAAERAADDAGSRDLLGQLDSIRVPKGLWPYTNAAALLRDRFGCTGAQTASGPIAGSTVQRMLSHAAVEIQAGKRDCVLLVAAEAEHTKRRSKQAGLELAWTEQPDAWPDETFDSDAGWTPWEERYRGMPPAVFALYENALRAARGESLADHRARVGRLWAGFSRVAADNPYAWIREPMSAEAIATPSDANRWIAFPYTKFLVANMVVDLGAAVIVCSVEAARRHGIPEDRWVFPWAATDVHTTTPMGVRASFHDQAALGTAGRRALALAGVEADQLGPVDLYSCFPSAVQIAADELGLGTDRPLTVTGGLTFSGGPFNSYVMHALATLMNRLRGPDRGQLGYSSGIGSYMMKHAAAVYSSEPPEQGYRYEDVTAEAQSPTLDWDESYTGRVQIETVTQLTDRDGSHPRILVAGRTEASPPARVWATSDDPDLLASLPREEFCGRTARVRTGGTFELL
ncbi:MAG: hypothetical protein AAF430_04495 [Myxococcota bacterium]